MKGYGGLNGGLTSAQAGEIMRNGGKLDFHTGELLETSGGVQRCRPDVEILQQPSAAGMTPVLKEGEHADSD